ncbi:double-strand break repair helicase AddA [Aliishimia ponticola]|uniref:DNA 3'-5' helicase n=1 Tax=Aliishimia ponticola TaxID=2499833 RepID=A0A4S4N9F3_9RHOB|nr:double-strand break repair helicase AddA [Aliishimia ponticola]THH34631.1 double-strand break repair helicase AddA [Aliishimia ponticola]
MIRDDATQAQVRAADPGTSTWLSANAGSGKTRVLTDRVARLLLAGTDPQQILCLTYTKAAASEMQNRLFQRLGDWAMCADEPLREALAELGHDGALDDDGLAMARTLFARAIETPGGLKIQTIHSFCAGLLRRFPMEAKVNPQFQEIEDRAAELLREEIVEDMATQDQGGATQALTVVFTGESLNTFTKEVIRHQTAFEHKPSADDLLQLYGLPAGFGDADIERALFTGEEQDLLDAMIPLLMASGVNDQKMAKALAEVGELTMAALPKLGAALLTQAGTALKKRPAKAVATAHPAESEALNDFMLRVEEAVMAQKTLNAVRRSKVLHDFAHEFLARYAQAKQVRGWLDFDDLILRTRALLRDEKVAAWVLYRLDGGISHILVDEAQDTSPAQWDVIRLLAQEFTSGEGARSDTLRTIFVVGDKKQSIYSFQGADPNEFDRMNAEFKEKLTTVGAPFSDATLEYSFRSSSAILRSVDLTFEGSAAAGFVPDQMHRAFHQDMPGRVDLWPVIPAATKETDGDWTDPVDRVSDTHHSVVLAQTIADQIAAMLDQNSTARIPFQKQRGGPFFMRRITPGDIMILVQRRSELFHEIIRACKQRSLDIAGADRLRVGAELAVRDLLALLSFLATPEDDLSLATVLRSPLCGWSERDLFRLAHDRDRKYLWEALREKADHVPETLAMLTDLRNQIDFMRPYELLERILTRHQGRARLLSRLGQEAEDGIDALLSQALAYERSEIPSMTGFLAWAQADDLEIKRQIDSGSDQIRVMTVHGAKGLEAPIVILPDCGQRKITIRDEVLEIGETPVWKEPGDVKPEAIEDALAQRKDAEERERKRLLYVAMTRAETWLIVAAAGDLNSDGSDWYTTVSNGLDKAGTIDVPSALGVIRRYETGDWTAAEAQQEARVQPELANLEPVYSEKITSTPKRKDPLTPSDLGGAKALPSPDALDEDTAKARGVYIHAILELLAATSPDTWSECITAIPAPSELPRELLPDAQAEARRVLEAPDLSWIFAPAALAEIPIHAQVGEQDLIGIIDRLVITDDVITIVDFKSNMRVPKGEEDCPEGILRQMGAYESAISQIYPGRTIACGILWTATATYTPLSQKLVREALARAA